MLNIKPIIVNGFGRGGTNILMNILLSHPATAMPSGELNKVIKGGGMGDGLIRRVFKKALYDLPIRTAVGDVFDRFDFNRRKNLPDFVCNYIDLVFWLEKQFSKHEGHNKWKNQTTLYTSSELRKGRLLVKAHNGLVFFNDVFRAMYPDIRFVTVVRDGHAVCESLMRRGWNIKDAANLYAAVGEEILLNSNQKDYLIIKFEEIIQDPLKAIENIYTHCGLDSRTCEKFRLQHKSVASKGSAKSVLHGAYDRQVAWFNRDELVRYFKPDVNANQIERLSNEHLQIIQDVAGGTIARLGYRK